MTCSHCNQEIADGAKFCTHCGTVIPTNISLPASWGRRLGNHIIDTVVIQLVIVGIITFAIMVVNLEDRGPASVVGMIGAISLYVVYFLVLETLFGTTVGKMITGTKVVNKEGNKPRFLQVLGRSFARYIPLEFISFLFHKYPVGWHDSLSGTYVVRKDVSAEQVRSIDPKVISAHKSSTGVIVAVVVIVVIVIIGILSSVVLASLSTARAKGSEAAKQADVTALKVKAELYAAKQDGSYTGFCQTDDIKVLKKYDTLTATYECNDSADAWVATVPVGSDFGCVDASEQPPTLIPITIGDRLSCPIIGTWTPTTARDGSFAVEFPGDALIETEENVQATEEDPSITYTSDLYTLKSAEGLYMLVHHAYNKPFTVAERKELLPGYVDQVIVLTKGQVVDESYTDGAEQSQVDFVIDVSAGKEVVKGRVIMTKSDVYMLLVGGDVGEKTEEGYAHFRDSFKITK